jgi:ketosteroid isomerase-like protein
MASGYFRGIRRRGQARAGGVFDLGEHTITFHVLHGRGQRSGADLAERFAHVHRWREGQIVDFKAYAHQRDALRDLGVADDAVEPIAP